MAELAVDAVLDLFLQSCSDSYLFSCNVCRFFIHHEFFVRFIGPKIKKNQAIKITNCKNYLFYYFFMYTGSRGDDSSIGRSRIR